MSPKKKKISPPWHSTLRKKKKSKSQDPQERINILLESGTLHDLAQAKKVTESRLQFEWEFYTDLAYQREQVKVEITEALNKASTKDFRFSGWQRCVRYKYSDHPLCSKGSLLLDGGRFNIGDLNLNLIPSFAALYISHDKDTAMQESFQISEDSKLSPTQLALAREDSISMVSISGTLERVLDVRTSQSIKGFFNIIKNFSANSSLVAKAKKLNIAPPTIVKDLDILYASILEKNWRYNPSQNDIPSNSQILGQLVREAKIEGILYPSSKTGKDCLAIFPENFENGSSFIKLDGELPPSCKIKKLDGTNWFQSLITTEELFSLNTN